MLLGAMVVGRNPLRDSKLAIDWTLYGRFAELLRQNPRFDKVVSYGSSGLTVRAEDVPGRLAGRCLRGEPPTLDADALAAALRDLKAFVEEDTVRIAVQVELFGFWSDSGFQIADNIAIVPNLNEPSAITLMDFVPQGRYCLEVGATVRLSFSEEFHPSEPLEVNADMRAESQLFEDAGVALQVMMVLQRGVFTPGPFRLVCDNWLIPSGMQRRESRPIYPTSFDRFEFDSADLDRLRTLFATAKQLRDSGPSHLLVALRRFYTAQFRSDRQDKLIDLVIAAEAMFLNDADGELSFRLATRAAIFLRDNKPSRTDVFQKCRKAYKTRNAIVHGSRIDAAAVFESARDMEELMREAISKALMLVSTGQEAAVTKWDNLAFLDL